MSFNVSIKNLIIELILSVFISYIFSLFTKSFSFWFIIALLLLVIWHYYNELTLLKILNPNKKIKKKLKGIEHISQTVAYYRSRSRREKIKSLRLLSKLNRDTQYLVDAVIICEHDGKISWCNQVSQSIFDFVWDKKLSKNIFNVIFYPEFKNYFQHTKRKRPLVLLTHNQRYIELKLHNYDSKSYLIIARDVTAFIRLLHIHQTFLTNMNHELRTPLTVLQGYLEIIEQQNISPLIYDKAINAMKKQSQRMTNLLNQLNILSKIETSDNKNHHKFNLSELILSTQNSTDIIHNNKQKIYFDIEPNIYIIGNENQIQSAISNLIYNAVYHAGSEATININLSQKNNKVFFSVSDDGIGIEAKHLAHLTERFYCVDESRSNKTGGSGLGLSIVQQVLEQHNSTLKIESEPKKGSKFSFIVNKNPL